MAMLTSAKASETKSASEQIAAAVDAVAENDTPFLKQDSNSELSILGDPTKIDPADNDTVYEIEFVLPKEEFDPNEFPADCVTDNGGTTFVFATTATQEKINPNDRAGFTFAAANVIQHFFRVEGSEADMMTEEEMSEATLQYFLNPMLVGATKTFVGRFLGVDKRLIPYFSEDLVVKTAISLIIKNPSVVNESYFTSRQL